MLVEYLAFEIDRSMMSRLSTAWSAQRSAFASSLSPYMQSRERTGTPSNGIVYDTLSMEKE